MAVKQLHNSSSSIAQPIVFQSKRSVLIATVVAIAAVALGALIIVGFIPGSGGWIVGSATAGGGAILSLISLHDLRCNYSNAKNPQEVQNYPSEESIKKLAEEKTIVIRKDSDSAFLSNDYQCNISNLGNVHKCVTEAFKHAKEIAPNAAKRFPYKIKSDQDLMTDVIWNKFTQNSELNKLLKATGDAYLVDSDDKDENQLGRLLMRCREALSSGTPLDQCLDPGKPPESLS